MGSGAKTEGLPVLPTCLAPPGKGEYVAAGAGILGMTEEKPLKVLFRLLLLPREAGSRGRSWEGRWEVLGVWGERGHLGGRVAKAGA